MPVAGSFGTSVSTTSPNNLTPMPLGVAKALDAVE